MMKWLEATIDKRIIETTEKCCEQEEINKLYNEIMSGIKLTDNDHYFELENQINLYTGMIVEMSYRMGLNDGNRINSLQRKEN